MVRKYYSFALLTHTCNSVMAQLPDEGKKHKQDCAMHESFIVRYGQSWIGRRRSDQAQHAHGMCRGKKQSHRFPRDAHNTQVGSRVVGASGQQIDLMAVHAHGIVHDRCCCCCCSCCCCCCCCTLTFACKFPAT